LHRVKNILLKKMKFERMIFCCIVGTDSPLETIESFTAINDSLDCYIVVRKGNPKPSVSVLILTFVVSGRSSESIGDIKVASRNGKLPDGFLRESLSTHDSSHWMGAHKDTNNTKCTRGDLV